MAKKPKPTSWQKLTPEEWAALHKKIQRDKGKRTVLDICTEAGVSTQRYYQRFPSDRKFFEINGGTNETA